MNTIAITGRLTAKPELKATPSGKNVCSFTLAVERRFKGADGNPITDFIDCVAWEHNAVFISKWFDKGVKTAITGELQTRTYTDSDGKNRKVAEVLVSTVEFADGKREPNTNANTNTNTNTFSADTNTFTSNTNDDFVPVDSDDNFPWS